MKRNIAIFDNDATDEEIAEYIRSRASVKKHAQHDQSTHNPHKGYRIPDGYPQPPTGEDWYTGTRDAAELANGYKVKVSYYPGVDWINVSGESMTRGVRISGKLQQAFDPVDAIAGLFPKYINMRSSAGSGELMSPIPNSDADGDWWEYETGGIFARWNLQRNKTTGEFNEAAYRRLKGFLRTAEKYGMDVTWDGGGVYDTPDDFLATLTTVSKSIDIAKMDSRKNVVFGWANVAMTPDGQVEDHQGHLIDIEDLEDAAYNFVVKYRVTGDMHEGDAFGELVESVVITEDKIEKAGFPAERLGHWWVGFRVPPEHWDAVERGDRAMFSIQGKARLEPTD